MYGALLAIEPKKDEWVAIIGIGGLGHLGVQYAKAMGMKVVAIDNRKEGADLANETPQGLRPDKTYCIDSEENSNKVCEELQRSFYETNPGVDKVVINTEAPGLVKWSQQFLRKGGQLVDVGLPSDSSLELDPFSMNFKEHTIRGRLICTPEQCQTMINVGY